jgi:hypothetical protein
MDSKEIKWQETRSYLHFIVYVALFSAAILFLQHINKIKLYEESFVDVKIKIEIPPQYHNGKNPYISFKAVGIKKMFEIRSDALEFTKINSLINKVKKYDTVTIKLRYNVYSIINTEKFVNNYNELYGFNLNGLEFIEYKKAIRAEDNSFMFLFYICIWIAICCKIYKYFEKEPFIDLIWSIIIGFFLILLYYRDVSNNLNADF